MKRNRVFLGLLVSTLAALALGQSVTGQWKGKIVPSEESMAKLKKNPEMMAKVKDALSKTSINLSLKGDKSFKIGFTGMGPGAAAPSTHTAEGTWSQKNSTVTLHITKEDGKAPTSKRPDQPITVSKDGKSMTMIPSGGGAAMGKIVFSHA